MTYAPKLIFFVTEDWYFCSHRLALARAARAVGFDVAVITRVQQHGAEIRDAGIGLLPIDLKRDSKNPLSELRTLWQVSACYRRLKPDIVHHVALKPVLYGTLAARMAGVPAVVNTLAGLGYLFSSKDTAASVLRPLVESGLRAMLKPNQVIVQNPDDRQLLIARGLIDPARTTMIRGSGVDLATFSPAPEPDGLPLVVLPARLLRDKGVAEFVAAARMLRQQGAQARFALVGAPDPANPASIPQATLDAWRDEGDVELWGWHDDMAKVFGGCHIVCLPSYREGLPKALLEGAACARPLVSCDVPGCREIVHHGVNGLLVPARDASALAGALSQLIENRAQRVEFGRQGRALVSTHFSIEAVTDQTLTLYRKLVPA